MSTYGCAATRQAIRSTDLNRSGKALTVATRKEVGRKKKNVQLKVDAVPLLINKPTSFSEIAMFSIVLNT